MKCPFVTKVVRKITARLDAEGKVVGEDTVETSEHSDCLRDECMVYDKSNAACSLFASNLRSGQILAEVKKSGSEMSKSLFERTETLGVIYSTNFQTLQDAVLSKLDLIRKSNEIMVMGLDRTTGSLEKMIESIDKLGVPLGASAESNKVIEKQVVLLHNDVKNSLASLNADLKAVLLTVGNDLKANLYNMSDAVKKEFGSVVEDLKQVRAAGESFVLFSNNALASLADVSKGIGLLDSHFGAAFKDIGGRLEEDLKAQSEALAGEIGKARAVSEQMVGLAATTISALGELSSKVGTLDDRNAAGLKELGGQVTESMKGQFEPLVRELSASRAAGEASVQSLNMVINSLTDLFKAVATLEERTGSGLGAVAQQVGGLGTKLDEMDKHAVVVQTQQAASFDTFARAVNEMGVSLGKSYESIVSFAQQQTEMSSTVVNQFKALEDGLRAMSEEGETPLRDIAHEMEKLEGMIHERLDIFKIGLEGLLALEKKGFDRNAEAVGELKVEYEKTVAALSEAAKSIRETETELKGFTSKTADSLNDNMTRVTQELSTFQRELAGYIKENLGRFTEILDEQKAMADNTRLMLESMNTVFKRQEEQLVAQEKNAKLAGAGVHNDRAVVMFHRGNYDAALLEINEALKLEESAEYYNNKALILSELGRSDDARTTFQKAIGMAPAMSEAYNNLGLLFLKIKDYDSAIATFTEATKQNINYALAYTNLGHAFAAKENFDEAIKAWEKVLAIDPTNRDAREALKLYKEGRIDGYTSET